MNQRKAYISPWVALLLAAVVALGCILAAAGVSYARYRSDNTFDRIFSVRESGTVLLGKTDENGLFLQEQSTWQTVDGITSLDFAISNGTDGENWSKVDQQASIRVLAGPGAWDGTLTLTVGETSYAAVPTAIVEGSALYRSFGEGWVLQFLDAQGNELSFSMDGEVWTTTSMRLTLTADLADTSLLRLQVISQEQ